MKRLLLLFIPLIIFSCQDNFENGIAETAEVTTFKSSVFYEMAVKQGYEVDFGQVETAQRDGQTLLFFSAVNENHAAGRSETEKLLAVYQEGDIQQVYALSYSEKPSEGFTGRIGLSSLDSPDQRSFISFVNGKVMLAKEDSPTNGRDGEDCGCSCRSVLTCVGYRIEDFNIVEEYTFYSGFPVSMGWEIASCYADGCPYE